jgi:hypothetical protein
MYYTSSTLLSDGTLTDADKAAADAADLSVDAAFAEATTITLPTTGTQGSTIVWASSNAAYIDAATGAVVLPTEGQVLVTLTATVTVGTEEAEVMFDVYVGTPVPDLFFSEYIEGGSQNKALEIFNPLDVAVDLSDYKVVLYSNGATTPGNTTTFTPGTMLAAGEVYVIYNSEAAQAIVDEGDAESTVTYFNGDDAIALIKIEGLTERPIDIFGTIGNDPGSEWAVGTGSTSNHTLVRKEAINTPNLVFTANEWEVYDQDTFTYLGSHTMVLPSGSSFVETFANSNATDAYADNSFVGNEGVTWTYVQSRNENGDANASGIDGNAIMLRRVSDDSKITSSTISGGIVSFSVNLYKGFTGGGDRQVELFINGVSYGTSTAFDDFDEHVFTVENINVSGDIVIEIRNITAKQVIIDDISWTQ